MVKDITGQRFGRLVVVKPTEERKNGYVVWECRCDCGNTTFALTNNLTRGITRSCGCLSKEYVAEKLTKDLAGHRFGKLVALRPTEERQGNYVVWECRCDCGTIIYVKSYSLTRGRATSCGCSRKDCTRAYQIKDLTGQRFGRLVAIRPTDMRKGSNVAWECKCDCGNTVFVGSGTLISGNTASCGCLKKDFARDSKPKDLSGQRFGRLVALRPAAERKHGYVMWECKCDCGNMAVIRSSMLVKGSTKSCGCLRKDKAIEG